MSEAIFIAAAAVALFNCCVAGFYLHRAKKRLNHAEEILDRLERR